MKCKPCWVEGEPVERGPCIAPEERIVLRAECLKSVKKWRTMRLLRVRKFEIQAKHKTPLFG